MKHLYYLLFILSNIISSCSVLTYGGSSDLHDISIHLHNGRGTLKRYRYSCSVKGPAKRYMYIYVPESYYDSNKSYPTLYLLHGANGNETSWIIKGGIIECIDSLTSADIIEECIYIFPNMNHYHNDHDYGQSREKKSIDAFFGLDGSVEHAFIRDVVDYVDTHFRTIPDKTHRAIAGLSLGGLQTIYISSNHYNYFEYIGLFSPLVYPPLDRGSYSYIYKQLDKKLSNQFDIPPSLYWIMVGEDDPYFFSAYFYSKLLRENKHSHSLYISEGGHSWDNWRQYCIMFIKELWRESFPP